MGSPLGSAKAAIRHVPVMAERASAMVVARPPKPSSARVMRLCSTPSGRVTTRVSGTPAAAMALRSRTRAVT